MLLLISLLKRYRTPSRRLLESGRGEKKTQKTCCETRSTSRRWLEENKTPTGKRPFPSHARHLLASLRSNQCGKPSPRKRLDGPLSARDTPVQPAFPGPQEEHSATVSKEPFKDNGDHCQSVGDAAHPQHLILGSVLTSLGPVGLHEDHSHCSGCPLSPHPGARGIPQVLPRTEPLQGPTDSTAAKHSAARPKSRAGERWRAISSCV